VVFDLLVHNAAVFDGATRRPEISAMGVANGLIVAVGGDELREAATASTRIVDAAGGLLTPGFIDAHIHPIEGGLEHARCNLAGITTVDALLATIGNYAAANPHDEWILGGGWQMATFPGGTPLATDLDRVVPDRPVYLPNRDHHGTWVNSVALARAGITRDTPDPADGRIERDADGNPTGTLHEGASELVKRLIPADTDDAKYRALLDAQRYLHSFGVTGWQDAIVGNFGGHTDTRHIYQRSADNGDLLSRVVAALWWDRNRGLEQLDELRAKRAAHTDPLFRATSIKIMLDGIPENHTAAMADPYRATGCRCTGDHRGISFLDAVQLSDVVTSLDADNWQVHIHAIGDRAVTESLDAIEQARAINGPSDNRHHLAHIQIVNPRDIARFASLDVTANIQTLWATNEPQMRDLNLPALGDERYGWQYPFGDLASAGAFLASGSDWPVSTPDPWKAMHVAVNRVLDTRDPDFNPIPLHIEHAMSLESAVASYTAGSARINHDDDAGSLAVGRRADFAIADRNPFDNVRVSIAETVNRSTYIGGVEVFAL
jgi:predicted amidohydrolase YtcJ